MSRPRSYVSPRRDDAARHTRARILDVAEQELERSGYHATTIAGLASAAGVSPQTIYNSIGGGKAAVIKALYDVRLAGDDEPVPMAERPEIRRIAEQSDATAALRAYIAAGRVLYERVGRLLGILLVDGPGADADLRAFVDTIERERRIGNASIVTHVAGRFGLRPGVDAEQAVDIVWTLTSFEIADRLIRRCGWSLDAYEQWLGDVVVGSLTERSG
ncbi:MAG TPA: TetR/AcrR family transcriptional regulator [Microlunatus sp.]